MAAKSYVLGVAIMSVNEDEERDLEEMVVPDFYVVISREEADEVVAAMFDTMQDKIQSILDDEKSA